MTLPCPKQTPMARPLLHPSLPTPLLTLPPQHTHSHAFESSIPSPAPSGRVYYLPPPHFTTHPIHRCSPVPEVFAHSPHPFAILHLNQSSLLLPHPTMPPPVTLHHALGGRLYDAVYEEDIDEARVRSLLGQGADTNWRHPEYVSGVAACREITMPTMRCNNMHACKDHIESSTIDMSSHCIYFLLFACPSREGIYSAVPRRTQRS